MGTLLTGHLVLQGSIPFRAARLKHVLNLPARRRLVIRWAKYPFCRRPTLVRGARGRTGEARCLSLLRAYTRFSNEDPAESELESKRTFFSALFNCSERRGWFFLVQRLIS